MKSFQICRHAIDHLMSVFWLCQEDVNLSISTLPRSSILLAPLPLYLSLCIIDHRSQLCYSLCRLETKYSTCIKGLQWHLKMFVFATTTAVSEWCCLSLHLPLYISIYIYLSFSIYLHIIYIFILLSIYYVHTAKLFITYYLYVTYSCLMMIKRINPIRGSNYLD